MKVTLDKTYMKYSFYVILTAIILYTMYEIIENLGYIITTVLSAVQTILALLNPLIVGLVIAYLLHPIVNWIESRIMNNNNHNKKMQKKHQMKRTLSVLLTYVLVVGIMVFIVYGSFTMINGQFNKKSNFDTMIQGIKDYAEKYNFVFQELQIRLKASNIPENFKEELKDVISGVNGFFSTALTKTITGIANFGGNVLNIFLGVIIGFYILKDIDYFHRLWDQFLQLILPERWKNKFTALIGDIDDVVSNFIRGQLLDGLIVGILSSIGLYIIGLDFAVIIGMAAGIANVIPYFGPILGAVPAFIVGLLSDNPYNAIFSVAILLGLQQLDGAIIAPKIVGDSVGVHPVFIIISIIIGGSYFGLLGMLLAVPAAAVIKLLIRRILKHYGKLEEL